MVKTKCTLNIHYDKIWRARETSRDIVFGNVKESYNYVPLLRDKFVKRSSENHIGFGLETV